MRQNSRSSPGSMESEASVRSSPNRSIRQAAARESWGSSGASSSGSGGTIKWSSTPHELLPEHDDESIDAARNDLDPWRDFPHGIGRFLSRRAADSRRQGRWLLDRPPR